MPWTWARSAGWAHRFQWRVSSVSMVPAIRGMFASTFSSSPRSVRASVRGELDDIEIVLLPSTLAARFPYRNPFTGRLVQRLSAGPEQVGVATAERGMIHRSCVRVTEIGQVRFTSPSGRAVVR